MSRRQLKEGEEIYSKIDNFKGAGPGTTVRRKRKIFWIKDKEAPCCKVKDRSVANLPPWFEDKID